MGSQAMLNLRCPGCRGSYMGSSGGRSQERGRKGLKLGLKSHGKRPLQDMKESCPHSNSHFTKAYTLTPSGKLLLPKEVYHHLLIPRTQLTQIPDGPVYHLKVIHIPSTASGWIMPCPLTHLCYYSCKLYNESINCVPRLTHVFQHLAPSWGW